MSEAAGRSSTPDLQPLTIVDYIPGTLHALNRDHPALGSRWIVADLGGIMRIYLLGFSDGTVKIGITSFPRGRIRNILSVRRTAGITSNLEMIAVSIPHLNAKENEARFLMEYGSDRSHGEYLRTDFMAACTTLRHYLFRVELTAEEKERGARLAANFDRISGMDRVHQLT